MTNATSPSIWPSVPGTTPEFVLAFQGGTTFGGQSAETGSVVNLNHDIGLAPVTAATAAHFLYDFYNKVYITPVAVNFGTISSTVSATINVWSAFLGSNTLTSIGVTNGDGITISGAARPKVFAPLELIQYSLIASLDGPSNINASFQFNFSAAASVTVTATGKRSVIWPFRPNWSAGISDKREFRTEILLSRSGKEQRRALRTTPRRTLEFTVLASGAKVRELTRLIDRWQNKTLLMADWVTYGTLAADLAENDATITLTADAPSWMVTNTEVIMLSDSQLESRTVQSVAGVSVTFSAGGLAWPAGTKVYRALSGLLDTNLTASLPSSKVSNLSVTFNVAPAINPVEAFPDAAVSVGGYEVFTRTPNWGEQVQAAFAFPISAIDYGRGRIENYRPVQFGTTTRRGTFYGLSRSDVDALISTFYRAKGRRGEFLMPTELFDLDLRNTLPANNAFMRVVGVETFNAYGEELVHRGVAVTTRDGQVFYRTIEAISTISDGLGNDTILQLTAGIPVELDPANIHRISWMPRHRFGSDSITINWLTDEVGEVPMSFTTLEALPGN